METDGLFTGEPKCLHDDNVQTATYSDRKSGKITYRVWTVMDGKERTFDRLAELMLRQVESGEDVKKTEFM